MKKVLFLGIVSLLILVSCKTTKGGHCEAYGKLTEQQKNDLVLR